MSVRFLGGGTLRPSSATDTFNRTSGNDLGTAWIKNIYASIPVIDPINAAGFSIGAVTGGQGLLISTVGNNNPATIWQSAICNQTARVRTMSAVQFAQCTWVGGAGPAGDSGPCCLINDNTGAAYMVQVTRSTGNVKLARTAGPYLVINNFGAIGVIGDVFRISADPVTNPAQVSITVTRNGVSLGTFVDASAARLQTGYSGGMYVIHMDQSGGVSSSMEWRNFSCGVGL